MSEEKKEAKQAKAEEKPGKAEGKKQAEKAEKKPKEAKEKGGQAKKKEKPAVKKEKRMVKKRAEKKRPKKSEKARKKQGLEAGKRKKPQFRGRFGKNSIRRKNKEKWMKWRVPRGKDLDKTRQYGKTPDSGYRSRKDIRGLHPSGYSESLVRRPADLEGLEKESQAARISSTVGKKKRNEIIKKANEQGIRVLN